jgi:hypothetical protein
MTTSLITPPSPTFSGTGPHDDWSLNLQMFGRFEGVNAPSSRLEALMMAHIKKQHFSDFVNVYQNRWWDYRRLAPGHSFMLFSREYLTAMQRGARDFVNSRGPMRRKDGKVMTRGEVASFNKLYGAVFNKQTEADVWERGSQYIVGLFKAMTMADMFGMPYSHFCTLAVRQALERSWTRVPQPWHLYSQQLGAETVNAWETLTTQRLITASHPTYLLDNYRGDPLQDAYHEWLIKQVQRRGDDPAMSLSIALFDKPQLPIAIAEKHFDGSVIRRARSMSAMG